MAPPGVAVNPSGVVMRRRSPLELLDLAAVLVRAEAGATFRATAVAATIAGLCAAAGWWLHPWAGVALGVAAARLGQVPALLAAGDRTAGRREPITLRRTARAWGAMVTGGLVEHAVLLVLVMFPPAALWMWVRSAFLPEVVLLERPTSGRFQRVGALAASGVAQAVVVRAAGLAIELWAMGSLVLLGDFVLGSVLGLGTPLGSVAEGEANPLMVLGSIAVQPLLAMARFAAYLDVRTRREGLDVWFSLWAAAHAPGPG